MMNRFWLLLLWFVVGSAYAAPGVMVVRYPQSQDSQDTRSRYAVQLLQLALDKTVPEYGAYKLKPVQGFRIQSRNIAQLARGEDLDVLWTMTSPKREALLQPIRIPILKGLMGYRLLLIRQIDAPQFAQINTLDELQNYVAGQGHDWPDTRILQANQIAVRTSTNYDALFRQLEAGRFDFMPRGFNEPFAELAAHPSLHLMVEPHLALFYPTAEYFFVNKHNDKLASRLRAGLLKAIDDGSFDALFLQFPTNARAFSKADLQSRTIITLRNPMLPEVTPLLNEALWYFPKREAAAAN